MGLEIACEQTVGKVCPDSYYLGEHNWGMSPEPATAPARPSGGFQNTGMEMSKENPGRPIRLHAALFQASCTPNLSSRLDLLTGWPHRVLS